MRRMKKKAKGKQIRERTETYNSFIHSFIRLRGNFFRLCCGTTANLLGDFQLFLQQAKKVCLMFLFSLEKFKLKQFRFGKQVSQVKRRRAAEDAR